VVVARAAHEALIAGLMALMGDADRETCRPLVDRLLALGYLPQRQKVQGYVLAFRNGRVGQTIAKIGAPRGAGDGASFSIKFYACRQPPPKFVSAVREAIETSNLQYRCCGCGVCGAGEADRGYRHLLADGEEFVRCGAYVVRILDLGPGDADGFASLLLEQHEYFLSRTG
jgi:hypothetical protein